MKSLRIRVLAAIAAAALPLVASAQAFPNKPIRLIIPFAPGGTTDLIGRIVADEMSRQLGQPVIVDNKAGAGGALGAIEAARAAPDGYTLSVATVSTMAVNPACNPKLQYKVEDFAAVTNFAAVPNVVAVNPSKVSQTNMKDFVAYLKANPGKLSYASSGTCGVLHMMGELFKVATGTYITHIPYRGSGPALNDVIAGQVEILMDNLPSSMQFIQSGKLRALAVAANKRVEQLPNVPTLGELGYKMVNDEVWYGLLAPAKTPEPIVKRLHEAAVKALAAPAVRDKLKLQGATPVANTPEQFQAQIKVEFDKMNDLVKKQGIKLEQ